MLTVGIAGRADFALAVDPFFASLRGLPRFEALLERIDESQRGQLKIAQRNGALDAYDALIEAGPARLESSKAPGGGHGRSARHAE